MARKLSKAASELVAMFYENETPDHDYEVGPDDNLFVQDRTVHLTGRGGVIYQPDLDWSHKPSDRLLQFKNCEGLVTGLVAQGSRPPGSPKRSGKASPEGNHFISVVACHDLSVVGNTGCRFWGDLIYVSSGGGTIRPVPSRNIVLDSNVGDELGRHAITIGGVDGIEVSGNKITNYLGARIDFEVRVRGDGKYVRAHGGINEDWRDCNDIRSARMIRHESV